VVHHSRVFITGLNLRLGWLSSAWKLASRVGRPPPSLARFTLAKIGLLIVLSMRESAVTLGPAAVVAAPARTLPASASGRSPVCSP
jgi:hypothetical protein